MRSLVQSVADRLLNRVVPRKTALAVCDPRSTYYCYGLSDRCALYQVAYVKHTVLASCDERLTVVGCC